MSDLSTAAEALNVPEDILQRSAAARATAEGTSTEEVLAAWAGGSPAPSGGASAPPADEPDTDETPTDDGDDAAAEADASPAEAPAAPAPAAPAATAPAGAVAPPPAPERVSPREALAYPVVVSVPTSGVTERTTPSIPRWLAAVFMILPAVGLLYLTGNSGAAECAEGSYTLDVDRATGVVRNCDGSEFEGRPGDLGAGGAFVATGQELYGSQACVGCHGAQGGGGSGPALTQVAATFSSCADHIEWVQLGTSGFQAAGRSTYGDLAKPVGGGGQMPAFPNLSAEDLASVVAFERIQFGGLEAGEVLANCGLVEAEAGAEGEAGTDAPTGTDGAGDSMESTTTTEVEAN